MRSLLLAAVFMFQVRAAITPTTLKQGDTITIIAKRGATSARLGERTIPLFRQQDGTMLGLMPVAQNHPPGSHTLTIIGSHGEIVESAAIEVIDAQFEVQDLTIRPGGRRLEPLPGEMEAVGRLRNLVTLTRHWQEPFASPVPGCMNSPFGVARSINGKLTGNYHRGIDQRSKRGRPIRAAAAGRVEIARMFRLHGGTVGIDHGQGVTSIYLHMSRIAARQGRMVRKGAIIGYVGATGFATGPHLHWQISIHGVPVNPLRWAPAISECP